MLTKIQKKNFVSNSFRYRVICTASHDNSIAPQAYASYFSNCAIFGRVASIDEVQGPDLQNILRQSYDYLTTSKLRSTYDGRLIFKTNIYIAYIYIYIYIYIIHIQRNAEICRRDGSVDEQAVDVNTGQTTSPSA